MSYLQFHLLFVLPPIAVLFLALKRRPSAVGRFAWLGLPLMSLVALVYTTPWDSHLVFQGVWHYGQGRVIATVAGVPLEEFAFFALQPLLTGLWLYNLLREDALPLQRRNARARWGGTALYGVAGIAGAMLLCWDRGYYLGLILAWTAPVLAGQWAYGGHFLWRARRAWLLGTAIPTVYLWVADRTAIVLGIWGVSPEYTTGLRFFGLPVEEAAFFLATNLMVIQGLLLFLWVFQRSRKRRAPLEVVARASYREGKRPVGTARHASTPLGRAGTPSGRR